MSAIDRMRRAVRSAYSRWPWRQIVVKDPCVYCVLWPRVDRQTERMTLEHILPRSADGADSWRNLGGAHRTCNHERGSMPLLPFLIYRRAIQEMGGKQWARRRREVRARIWRSER